MVELVGRGLRRDVALVLGRLQNLVERVFHGPLTILYSLFDTGHWFSLLIFHTRLGAYLVTIAALVFCMATFFSTMSNSKSLWASSFTCILLSSLLSATSGLNVVDPVFVQKSRVLTQFTASIEAYLTRMEGIMIWGLCALSVVLLLIMDSMPWGAAWPVATPVAMYVLGVLCSATRVLKLKRTVLTDPWYIAWFICTVVCAVVPPLAHSWYRAEESVCRMEYNQIDGPCPGGIETQAGECCCASSDMTAYNYTGDRFVSSHNNFICTICADYEDDNKDCCGNDVTGVDAESRPGYYACLCGQCPLNTHCNHENHSATWSPTTGCACPEGTDAWDAVTNRHCVTNASVTTPP